MQTAGDNRLGTTVENYKLLSVLGAGSMSVVYLAQRLDDPSVLVAVKLLRYQGPPSSDDHKAFLARFQREARAASQLRNEYILPVLSSGDAGDLPYMVMPVIVGGTLSARLASQPQPMPLGEIARYLRQLATAIDYAHQQGVIHRDIKPANILLDEHGHIYLTDFGIARLFDSGDNALTRESAPTLTRTGQVLGTPYYMAPEQIQGKPVGPATDIYALGVVLYQMVTGQVPFHGDTPLAVALQHLQEAPSAPGLLRHELPAPLEAVILRALAKDPADRYASATELAEGFEAGLADIDDPLATQAPTETWPFSTRFASGSSTIAASPPLAPTQTPMPQVSGQPERLVGLTLDGYHLGAVIESDDLGDALMAHRDGSADPFRVRFLRVPPDATPKQVASYLLRFEQQAHDLAALRHPNLAPVVGYGAYEGRPYLITTDYQGAALSTELAQHGAAELSAIGDCLDQVAAGLECAHGWGILHLSLTADRIFRQDDGSMVVTDVGVRGMLDEDDGAQLQPSGDAYTPEQLAGKPVGPYTDVYALGVVLYHLLTGREVFTGATPDAIAQQHLHATIPPLRRWRPSLPTALDRVVSRAMAKEPERRYQTPQELAEAYHAAIAQTRRDGSLVAAPSYAALRQNTAGSALAGTPALTGASAGAPAARSAYTAPTPAPPARTATGGSAPPPPGPGSAPTRLLPSNLPPMKSRVGAAVIGVVLLISLVAGAFAWYNGHRTPASANSGGATSELATVTFADNSANGLYNTDALNIDVTTLPAPQAGHWYEAWLINDQSEQVLPLGKLVQQSGQSHAFTLKYAGNGSQGRSGTNLLGFGNRIKITDETRNGSLPSGPVVMEGAFPPHAFIHIQHLLVAFPTTPNHQGLLVGMIQQMNLLYQESNVLQQWIGLHYPKSTQCAAQSVVDIIEGQSGAHYAPLGAQCNVGQQWPSGDGFGLLGANGYLAGVSDHAALAASADDATPHIRLHSEHVQIAIENITGWLQTIDQDALKVLAGTGDANTSSQIVNLSKIALLGQDLNNDESIDPVKGEAGAELAYAHGQLLAMLQFGPSH